MKRLDKFKSKQMYVPAATVRSVKSNAWAHRVLGWKTERNQHLQSTLEWNYFCILEWSQIVESIKEKYELPLDQTVELAERLGINHPKDKKMGNPKPIWTDFYLKVKDGTHTKWVARSVIPSGRLTSRGTIARLELERAYWEEVEIDWGIVTESEISKTAAENVAWLHGERDVKFMPNLTEETIMQIEPILFERLQDDISLAGGALQVDRQCGFDPGTCLWIFQYLIANRVWEVDMNKKIDTFKPIVVNRALGSVDKEGVS